VDNRRLNDAPDLITPVEHEQARCAALTAVENPYEDSTKVPTLQSASGGKADKFLFGVADTRTDEITRALVDQLHLARPVAGAPTPTRTRSVS
jgi:hypothetical protein